jgi:hypothetical protein
MKKILLALSLGAMSLMAADATGTWVGTLTFLTPGENSAGGPAHLVLKQDGTKLTGTAGPDASEQHAIDEGKAENGRLIFALNSQSMKFDLKLEGDEISGEVTGERDGQTRKAKLVVKRQP